jgi:hypothetical protein
MGMADEARERNRQAEQALEVQRARAKNQIRVNEEWSANVAACVAEFLSSARELGVSPDRAGLTGKTWLINVPTSSRPWSTEPHVGLPTQAVAVRGNGSWSLVRYRRQYSDQIVPNRNPKPPKLIIERREHGVTVSVDDPVNADMVRQAFVARLARHS